MEKARALRELLSRRIVFLDGATGTELMKRGLPPGVSPELWACEHPGVIAQLHREYAESGSDIVLTNTFGANRVKLRYPDLVEKVNGLMAITALEAVDDRVFVAGSIGPTGLLMYPQGSLRVSEAYSVFREQAEALVGAGIEIFFLETFSDPRELKAAFLAVRDVAPEAFVSIQMTFGESGLTLSGTGPAALALLAEHLGPDAVGMNCSLGPEGLFPIFQELARFSKRFLVVEPNAGLPAEGAYTLDPERFASWAEDFAWAGANIIGGCCGTGPEHVREFVRLVGRRPPQPRETEPFLGFSSLDRVVPVGKRALAVGESINPTGKPRLKRAIAEMDTDYIVSVAKAQERADLLDVNLGLERLLPEGIVPELFSRLTDGPPLSCDLSSPELIQQAFAEMGGIGLLNSLTAKEDDIASKVGILKKHGGFAVLLPIDEDGLGETSEERVAKIKRGMDILREHGFPPERVIADPVVKPLATGEPSVTIETLRKLKSLGLLTVAGVSNISHGLPARAGLTASFLSALLEAGLDLAIIDVTNPTVMEVFRGAQVLAGRIEPAEILAPEPEPPEPGNPEEELRRAIFVGDKHLALKVAESLLESGASPDDIIKRCLGPAMDRVGESYERKRIFLPHLVRAAEAAQALTEALRPRLGERPAEPNKGTVVIATVRGDVHDIGKNLVALFLRNSGFRVIDLGKDVPSDRIVEEAERVEADIIALSALMSTTAPRMEEVIRLVREKGLSAKVIVGGAVVNQEFAKRIGADGYGPDAYSAVRLAEGLLGRSDKPKPPEGQ
jgi:5-methyltetrahydrofolate--homocysteine methyltransferase